MASLLTEHAITFERNVQIEQYNVDFLIGRTTIIECYGDYRHCNPMIYADDYYHETLHQSAQQKHQRDTLRQAHLEALGYRVYVFWEHDIRDELERIRREVMSVLEKIERDGSNVHAH
jgi:very-short-patch-repair endonuclease